MNPAHRQQIQRRNYNDGGDNDHGQGRVVIDRQLVGCIGDGHGPFNAVLLEAQVGKQ